MTEKGVFLTARNGVWHYYRRVPSEYAALDNRLHVKLSTKIKVANDRTGIKAMRVAAKINETQEAYWRGLADGRSADAKQAYSYAVKIARSLGLDYLSPTDAAQRPLHPQGRARRRREAAHHAVGPVRRVRDDAEDRHPQDEPQSTQEVDRA